MASSVEVQHVSMDEIDRIEQVYKGLKKLPSDVLVYSIDGPFFFGAVENLEQTLAQTHADPRVLIIRLRRVPFMDITGLNALEEVAENFRKRGVHIILCEANALVRAKIEKTGIVTLVGESNCLDDFPSAVERCDKLPRTVEKSPEN